MATGKGRGEGVVHSHFGIAIGATSIAYCYIRKNACSAWKRLFLEESPFPFERSEWKRDIAFMAEHHGLRTVAEIERHAHRVVVVRDPVERFVSAFVSLLIAETPPATDRLRRLSEKRLGRPVDDVSFDMMLEGMLPHPTRRQPGRLDKHFWPQTWHLAPTTYTDVIDIEHLRPAMTALVGEDAAAKYFGRPVNATSATATYDDDRVPALPVRLLRERYRQTGVLPSKTSFTGGGRDGAVRAAYAGDVALYAACRARRSEKPAAPVALDAAAFLDEIRGPGGAER